MIQPSKLVLAQCPYAELELLVYYQIPSTLGRTLWLMFCRNRSLLSRMLTARQMAMRLEKSLLGCR